ncbi:unnamed protein product, partial [marine sediment metagenome]
ESFTPGVYTDLVAVGIHHVVHQGNQAILKAGLPQLHAVVDRHPHLVVSHW